MLENIRLSFRGIWSHKMRSFLTMLGIIIGIAAIIAIVSTIQGTNDQIEKNLIGSGSNNVKVTLQKDGYDIDLSYDSVPAGITEVSDSTLDQIKDIDHVESASLYKSRQDYGGVYYLNTTLSGGTVLGIDSDYFDTCGYTIMKGRGFSQNDYDKSQKVALIDEKAQKALFQGESAIGKTIEIKGEPFSVVGIVTEKDSYELVINSIEDYYTYSNDSSAGNIFVPESVWPVIYRYDEPQNLILKTDSADNMAAAGKALLVGGIGVMNIMLVSVTERTSEIGLKKAIGAGKGAILGQFLTEAVVLTSIGGLVGVIVGVILSKVISALNGTPTSINPAAAVLAVLFSMAIGIIFGILPSHKAANLNPIDALRHE